MNWYAASLDELIEECGDRACAGTGSSFLDAVRDKLVDFRNLKKAESRMVDIIAADANVRFAATLDALAEL